MTNHPLKIHDYHSKIINSREEFIRDFEKIYGRKKGFKFYNYLTDREKLVYILVNIIYIYIGCN